MKYYVCFVLLSSVASVRRIEVNQVNAPGREKPLCKTGKEWAAWPVGEGGKWKPAQDEFNKDVLPAARKFEAGCKYEKLLAYEPKNCRLPTHPDDVPQKPRRVMFIGDSVMDNSATSFTWFYQKEFRMGGNRKPCLFAKDEMEKHLRQAGRFDKKTINDAVHFMVKQGVNNKKGKGHNWWGCQNSTVMYAPVLTFTEQNPEVIKAFMYTVKTFGEEPLGPQDVMVMNWGLHGVADGGTGRLAKMDKEWTPALTLLMKEWAQWKKEGTAPKLIWREVSPQHFPNPGGGWKPTQTSNPGGGIMDFFNLGTKKNEVAANKNEVAAKNECAPIGDMNKRVVDHTTLPLRNNNMFKKAVEDAGLSVDGKDIEILPVWRATAERFDEHPINDCTHYCIYGSAYQYWNSALLATASNMLEA